MLGGLPKAPTEDSPFAATSSAPRIASATCSARCWRTSSSPTPSIARRCSEPIAIISKDTPLNHIAAPYFVEHVRKLVQAKYGGRDLYDRGLQASTRRSTCASSAPPRRPCATGSRTSTTASAFAARSRTSTTTSCAKFLEAMPQPYAGPKPAAFDTTQQAARRHHAQQDLPGGVRAAGQEVVRARRRHARAHGRVRRGAHRALDRATRQQARRRRSHPRARRQGRGQARQRQEGLRRDRRAGAAGAAARGAGAR